MSTNKPKRKSDFLGQFLTLQLKSDKMKWPDVHILSYSKDYVLIKECPPPHDPAKKLIGKEFETALLSFTNYFKKNLSKDTITFSKNNSLKYNVSNGLIAVYSIDRISIAKVPFFWEETLKTIGYTRDEKLPVPFDNGEAYYDKSRDELYTIW